MIDMMKEKLDAIIEDRDSDTQKQEKQILQLQDYNIWNVWEEKNIERQMTVEFEKYLIVLIRSSSSFSTFLIPSMSSNSSQLNILFAILLIVF